MIVLRLCDRLLGLVSTLVLARLLVPSDFGLIAMAMSFIALIELASAFSFEIALIQRADPARAHYDTAWTLNLGFALFCALTTAALSPFAAHFYSEPRLVGVMAALAAGWAVQGFENIGIVNFRRRMDFSSEFKFMFAKRIAGFLVTIVLAFSFRSYWALIAGQLTGRLVGVALSYVMEPFRPRLSLAARSDLFSFSGWMFITNMMAFGLLRLPHFLIGRVEGAAALGFYTIASEFARLPSSELSAPINRAVLPGLSRLTEDRPAFWRVFTDVIGMTIALTLPASIGLAMVAGLLVQVVLGPQWTAAAPILAVLAVSGAIEVIMANNGTVYLAMGKPRLPAMLCGVKLAVLIGTAAVLVPDSGLMGMAVSELIASVFAVILSVVVMMKVVEIPLVGVVRAVWRPFVASALMGACLWALHGFAGEQTSNSPLTLLGAIGVGAVGYVASLFILWWLSGRPAGAEATVVARARLLLAHLLPGLARG